MSARRQARARNTPEAVRTVGGLPRCLVIGRCVEVWGLPDDPNLTTVYAGMRARTRFRTVRAWWLRGAGIGDKEGWQLIPAGAAWSVETSPNVTERLARAEATLADLSALREEADVLLARANNDDDPRAQLAQTTGGMTL